MNHVLTLTYDERKAIDWVGYRYSTGDDFSKLLWRCENDAIEEWLEKRDITFQIPENIAWQIKELFEEEDLLFPCFSEPFKEKLMKFYESIV